MATKSLEDLYSKKNNSDYYSAPRLEMLQFIPSHCKKILDVGCGDGSFLSAVKSTKDIEAWGVDISKNSIEIAEKRIDKALHADLTQDIQILPDDYFDAIFFNDVLEHIINPKELLINIKKKLNRNGIVVASIPNIRHYRILIMLLKNKDFKYEKIGVMDETHLRFFTKKSMIRLFDTAGYQVTNTVPLQKTKSFKPILLNLFSLGFAGNDISYLQYAITAKKHALTK